MEGANVAVEFSKGEWGKGQEEINLRYAEALEIADRHTLYKHGAREIAHLRGCPLTFMAKYDIGAAGSSCHLHSSLWAETGEKPLFPGNKPRTGSQLFQQWLAGQLALAREFIYFYAPTVNSYPKPARHTLVTGSICTHGWVIADPSPLSLLNARFHRSGLSPLGHHRPTCRARLSASSAQRPEQSTGSTHRPAGITLALCDGCTQPVAEERKTVNHLG